MESESDEGSKKGAGGRPKGKGRTRFDILIEKQGDVLPEPRRKSNQKVEPTGSGPRES